jgi:hypothetical protein
VVEPPDQRRRGRRRQRERHGSRRLFFAAALTRQGRGSGGGSDGGRPGGRDLVLRPPGGRVQLALLLLHLRVAEDLLDAARLAAQRDADHRANRRRLRVLPRPPERSPSLPLPPVPVRRRERRYTQVMHLHDIDRPISLVSNHTHFTRIFASTMH